MAGGGYQKGNGDKGKSVCCLKFWLSFFVIATLALTGVIIWLVLSTQNNQSVSSHSSASNNGLLAAAGGEVPAFCTLPAAPGPCKSNLQRYFYDTTTGSCTKFIYGGCSGNANNFVTLDACIEACAAKQVVKPDFCLMEKDPGPCYANLPRYAYDKNLDKCVEFTFGGCGGNRNNFVSMDECEKQCKEPTGDSIPVVSLIDSKAAVDNSVCHLPRESGNCRGYLKRWGFDPNSGKCVQFIYGGCGGNENNFESLEACEQKCKAGIPMALPANEMPEMDPICQLPQETGPCRGIMRRWAFDVTKGTCVEFTYGGCQGNENNFETWEACETRCPTSTTVNKLAPVASGGSNSNPICKLPQEVGPCRATIDRWSFDASKGRCIHFTYGGCGGNENNFETKEKCEAACKDYAETLVMDTSMCQLPRVTGNCRGYIKRWGFDPNSGQCVQFVYGGCGGNANNFETKEACEEKCRAAMPMPLDNNDSTNDLNPVCKLSADPGPCNAAIPRWAFDLPKGECVEFYYGGCQGNENNFETKEACEAKCSITDIPMLQPIRNFVQMASNNAQQVSVCQMPHERGECMAYIPRWGFDARSGKCIQFIYGGCGGNANNFETQAECENACKANIPMLLPSADSRVIDPVCKLPKEVGPCRGSNKRWAFNFQKGVCEEFIYGGCRGNANNFETKMDCETRCGSSKPGGDQSASASTCNLPHERGNCRSAIQRWGYDPNSGTCTQFIYGGCGGNANNFETKEDCERKCLSNSLAANNGALDAVCRLPQDVGPCRSSLKRWAYDVSRGECIEFIYGGCRGNDNNFETKEACESKCGGSSNAGSSSGISGQATNTSICRLPRERGNCYVFSQRWGYDPDTDKCVMFVYGGCGGNENNFETKEACENRCLLFNTVKSNPSYNFEPVDSAQICALPTVVGDCRASHRRWTYDASKGGCIEFIYSGCGGNANNFEDKEACESKCGSRNGDYGNEYESRQVSGEDDDVCYMPLERGPCRGYMEKWGFDPKSKQCTMFIFGGCGGNSNNFESREACELRCVPGYLQPRPNVGLLNPICRMPKDTGPCRGSQRRWAFDTSANACVEFIYGGCRGNENNFESKEACEAICRNNSF